MERLNGEAIILNGIEKSIGSSLCEVSAGIGFYSTQETSSAVLDAKQFGEDKQEQDSIIPYGTPTDESSSAGAASVCGTLPHHSSVLLQFTANPSPNLQVEIMHLAGMLPNPNLTVGDSSSPLCNNPNINTNEGSPPSCFPNPNLNESSPPSNPSPNLSESFLICNPSPNTNINGSSPASRLPLAVEEGAQQRLVSSHACKYCSKTFPSGRALGGHMRAHGSFSVHWEGVGTLDIMANDQQHINRKIITVHHQLTSPSMFDTQLHDEQMQQEGVNLSTNCRLAIDYQSVEDGQAGEEEEDDEELGHNQQLIYALRRNPKRNRRFSDQEFSSEEETMVINNANDNIDLSPPNSAVGLMPISCSKKPMFSNLQEKAVPAVCTECGKEFNSWKALFGHMRCHPEREWRGIQPPAEYCMRGNRDAIASTTMELNSYHGKPVQPSNYALMRRKKMTNHFKSSQISHAHDDNHVVNQTKEGGLAANTATDCIKGELQWSAKEVMLEEEEESETESIEAAYISNRDNEEVPNSSFLHRGKRSRRSHFTVKSLRAVELAEFAPAKLAASYPSPPQIIKQEEIEMANCLVMLALAGSVAEQQEGETTDDDELGSDKLAEAEEHYFGGAATSAGGDASISGSSTKFECATCKRSFKTHQALGGHRASHKKVKGCFAKTTTDFDTCTTAAIGVDTAHHHHHHQQLQLLELESDAASSKLRSQPQNSKCHQCSICLRVFSSGQALGGHKRCHWAADKVVALSQITTSHTTMSTLACVAAAPPLAKATFFTRPPEDRAQQLFLDLNLPAPLDEDDRKHCASNAEATFTTASRSKGDVQELDARAAIGSFLSLGHTEAPTNAAQRSHSEAATAPSNAHSSSLAPPISIHEIDHCVPV